ncbi:15974_t:CDS:2, partial [Cetraspora pellucida]
MNLNGNLHKGQCQPALLIMQNVRNITPEQNTPQTENVTSEQNPLATPESDFISFDENPPTLQPREASAPAIDPRIRESEMSQRLEAQHPRYSASFSLKQNSMSYQDKTILIHKNIANRFEFYDGKRKWYGVKEDFCALYNKYHFIKANNGETIMEAYKRINNESEAIAKKTNNLATTGALIFAERYEGEANQYDINSMYIFEMIKKDASWPIAPATIEGNPPKKSLQCTRYLCYNPHGIYTHYDLECGIEEKVSKALLVSLWGALYEQKNGQNYGLHPRIKPFLLASARKRISEIVKPLGDQVK